MELLSVTSVLTVSAVSLLVIVLSKIFAAIYKQQTYWKRNNVPHIPSVPILGPAWRFLLRKISFVEYSEYVYYHHPNAKYVGTMDFAIPNLIIRDAELIREITVKNFEHFMDHRTFLGDDVEPLFSKNVFSLRGEEWREMRNILSPSFTASKMRSMFELISKCSQEFVDYLSDHPEECASIEAKDTFTRYTNDVIATVAFGINVNSMKDRENEFFTKGKTVFSSIFDSMVKIMAARLVPGLLVALGITIVPRDTTNFFRKVISENLRARDEQNIVRPDMLHLLMQARDKEKSTHQMTIDDIVSQAFIFFLAGFDSSSNLMCYMVYELAVNPDIQERVREEVDDCMREGNGQITYEALSKMVYMDMVIAETFRLHPAVIFTDRVCTRKFDFPPAEPGYSEVSLHPGETIWIPTYSLHHDPKYFPNPQKFDPERFSEENKNSIVPYTYFPFGLGPRKCIGDRFALMETKIVMTHLLHKFVVKRTEKTQVPLVLQNSSFTPLPVGGYWVGFEKRTASNS